MNDLPKIEFSTNWNGKLINDMFPTFRLENPTKYQVGKLYSLYLSSRYVGRVELVKRYIVRYQDLKEAHAFADVGRPLAYLKSLLCKFYPKANWSIQKLYWLWFKHIDHEKEKDNLLQQRSDKLGIQADLFTSSGIGLRSRN